MGKGRKAHGTVPGEWENLPVFIRREEVRPYYDMLRKKRVYLRVKRILDIFLAAVLVVFLLPAFILLPLLIVADSKGGAFYGQVRITRYGKRFKIWKFRTMAAGADRTGPQVTVGDDGRVTRVGKFLRRYRLDELPQLFNILAGDMTFVGTRPEVPHYVRHYTPEMMATLLLPAGVTSRASIRYKDEAELLAGTKDADGMYVREILPAKMRHNLAYLSNFGFWEDLNAVALTMRAVFWKKG